MRRLSIVVVVVHWCTATLAAQMVPEQSPVAQLRQLLQSPDAEVRLAAAAGLAVPRPFDLGQPYQAAVADLMRVVAEDADEGVAEMAALALHGIGSWPPGVFEFVGAKLATWRAAGVPAAVIERMQATLQHRERGWPGAALVPDLVLLLHERATARAALVALAMLGDDAAAAMPDVDAMLPAAADRERWRATFTLVRIGATRAPSLRAARGDRHDAVRLWAAHAVAQPTPAELEPWLGDARVVVRQWALQRVAPLGASAAPIVGELVPLLAAMATRGDALGVVQQLGPHAAAIAPALVPWLDDAERIDVAVAALAGIGPAAAEVAAAPLVRFVTQPCRGEHGERMRFENQVLTAVAALAAIAPGQAVDALWPGFVAPLPSPWPGEWVLVTRFCFVGAAGVVKLPELRRLLASDDRNDRLRALMALRGIGAAAAPALAAILPCLHDVDEFVRREATAAVLAMGPAAAPALPELDSAFTIWPEHRRRELVPGLAAIGPAAEPLLLRALREGDDGTRQVAAVQLWQAKTLSAAAMTAMAESPETNVLDCYLRRRWPELCRVEAPWTRWTAGSYIGELTRLLWASRAAPPAGDERRPWREEGTLTEWVLGFAGHQDATVRAAAAHVLGLLPSTPATLAALRELASDGHRNTRLAALWALGRPQAHAAVDVLVAALQDADWSVAATADMALRGVFVR
ncbi:MAG: HEAT repeat domain-containing protein [Planctomycetes bacterium]|nr:HEAT repeat domain-containing protein [Planctomycetota bacterium]